MTETLSAQYESAFLKQLKSYDHIECQQAMCDELDDLHFTQKDIKRCSCRYVQQLSSWSRRHHSVSHQGIHRYTNETIALRRFSLDTGKLPEGTN